MGVLIFGDSQILASQEMPLQGLRGGHCSKGFPMGPCYGPLFDSGGVCSVGPYFVYGIGVQIRGPCYLNDQLN